MSIFALLSPSERNQDGRLLLSQSIESLLSLDSLMTCDNRSTTSSGDLNKRYQNDFTRHAVNFVRGTSGKSTSQGSQGFILTLAQNIIF